MMGGYGIPVFWAADGLVVGTFTNDASVEFGHSGDEQSLYQVQGSQIWLRGMAGWDATEGVVTSVAGFSIVEGVACRRVEGVKKGCFRCSKLSPHFMSPNSMDPRTL